MSLYKRDVILDHLAQAAIRGNLGLFVGAGFTRAVTEGQAPSWNELLDKLAVGFGLGLSVERGKSNPQLASDLIDDLARFKSTAPEMYRRDASMVRAAAALDVKQKVCEMFSFRLEQAGRMKYEQAFKDFSISWVVTTNYDLCIEQVVDKADPLLPNQVIPYSKDRIPVYHLHGHRLDASSIVLAEEDYVHCFRRDQYGQTKLAFLLSESTTLVLGYALSDTNVRTALDWSRSYNADNLVVQALWTRDTPNPEPYPGVHGAVILEISDIAGFIEVIKTRITEMQTKNEMWLDIAERFAEGAFDVAFLENINGNSRDLIYKAVQQYSMSNGRARMLESLERVFNVTWEKSRAWNAFSHYETFLSLVLDGFKVWKKVSQDPTIFAFLERQLSRLSRYIEPDAKQYPGYAWEASKAWQRVLPTLPSDLISELRRSAIVNEDMFLLGMLKQPLPPPPVPNVVTMPPPPPPLAFGSQPPPPRVAGH